jgi:hypothetical protein
MLYSQWESPRNFILRLYYDAIPRNVYSTGRRMRQFELDAECRLYIPNNTWASGHLHN